MTEAEFTEEVAAMAGAMGLLLHHCTDSRRCIGQAGFPDLIIVGVRGIIFAELKIPGGETSAEQDLWHWTLHQANMLCSTECERSGHLHQLWTPADLENGRIKRELEEISTH